MLPALLVVLLPLERLVSRFPAKEQVSGNICNLLGEQFDSQFLIVHSDFGLAPETSTQVGVPRAPGALFVFPNLVECTSLGLHIDLPGLNDFLEDLCVLLCKVVHFVCEERIDELNLTDRL